MLRSAYINFWSVYTYQSWDPVNDVTNRHYSTKFALSTNFNFTHDLEVSIQLKEIPPLCVLYYKKVYNQRVKYYKKLLVWSGPPVKLQPHPVVHSKKFIGSIFCSITTPLTPLSSRNPRTKEMLIYGKEFRYQKWG